MPIFEYECTECGERVEHLQLSRDSPLSECPECGGALRKLMSAPAFQFKGTGWYVTDYPSKRGSSAEVGESKNGDAHKPAGGGESKSAAGSSDSGSKSDDSSTSTIKPSSKSKPSSSSD